MLCFAKVQDTESAPDATRCRESGPVIRIRIHMFLGLLDPDPSIIKQI
jgi:hypothetical protein